jgi:hypothetical protein
LALTAFVAFAISRRIPETRGYRQFLMAFAMCLIGLFLCYVLPDEFSIGGLLVLIPALAFLSVQAFPLAIQRASLSDKMLAAGLFVAGLEIPDSFIEIWI